MRLLTDTQPKPSAAKGTATPKKPGNPAPASGAMSYQLGFLAGS